MYYYENVNNECVAIFTFYEAELMRGFFYNDFITEKCIEAVLYKAPY